VEAGGGAPIGNAAACAAGEGLAGEGRGAQGSHGSGRGGPGGGQEAVRDGQRAPGGGGQRLGGWQTGASASSRNTGIHIPNGKAPSAGAEPCTAVMRVQE